MPYDWRERLLLLLKRWCPLEMQAKQRTFLTLLDEAEVMFGGAAGGGKSVSLLAAALLFADLPGYHALLLRRTFRDLNQPDAILHLSRKWLYGKAAWSERDKRWTFPSGATLTFGYLESENDVYQYQGAAYAFIGFDELTQFSSNQYTYLFSRLRRPAGATYPIRMRSASNPGGIGHQWVRERFIPNAYIGAEPAERRQHIWSVQDRLFVPSMLDDNAGLDRDVYRTQSLSRLDSLTRRQLEEGDWGNPDGGRIKATWFRRWTLGDADTYHLETGRHVRLKDAVRVTYCDPAGTSADVVAERRTGNPSYSAIVTVDFLPLEKGACEFAVVDVVRQRAEAPDVVKLLKSTADRLRPSKVCIEDAGIGKAVFQFARQALERTTVESLPPKGKDKLSRAVPLLTSLEKGNVYFPAETVGAAWLPAYEAELLAWTGADGETADQIDATAYAAMEAVQREGEGAMDMRDYIGGGGVRLWG